MERADKALIAVAFILALTVFTHFLWDVYADVRVEKAQALTEQIEQGVGLIDLLAREYSEIMEIKALRTTEYEELKKRIDRMEERLNVIGDTFTRWRLLTESRR